MDRLTTPEPTSPSVGLLRRGHHSPALTSPRASCLPPRDSTSAQSHLQLFKATHPNPAHLASPTPFHRNHKTSSRPHCSLPGLVTDLAGSPGGPARLEGPFLLGTMSNNLSFKWQSTPDLLGSPSWNNQKKYI